MVRVYICKFSEAEMFDDEKVIEHDFNNEVLKIKSKKVPKDGDEDQEVIDIPEHFRYQKDEDMKKKTFTLYMKTLVKNTLAKMKEEKVEEEQVKKFKTEMQNFVKFLLQKYDSIDVYLNEKPGADYGHLGIGVYVNDADATPTFYYIRRALRDEKC